MKYYKKSRKGLSILLATLLMIVSLVPCTVLAIETSNYNINVNDTLKPYIFVLEDSIAVLSSETKSISAAELTAALTVDGYTVSYKDNSGVINTTTSKVKDGYVVLTPAEGETIEIPIVSKFETEWQSRIGLDGKQTNNDLEPVNATGVYDGKTVSVSNWSWNVTSEMKNYNTINPCTGIYKNAGTPVTFVSNIYATGNVKVGIGDASTSWEKILFMWNDNGTYSVQNNKTEKNCGSLERGRWHNVAVTYDPVSSKIYYYVDGNKIDATGTPIYHSTYTSNIMNRFQFGTWCGSGGLSGMVIFDDIELYYGGYTPQDDSESSDDASYELVVTGLKNYIIPMEENGESVVAVLSSERKKISAADIAANITATGYTVSYVDEAKQVDGDESEVHNGFVQLLNDNTEETIYIPIVSKIAPTVETAMDKIGIGNLAGIDTTGASFSYTRENGATVMTANNLSSKIPLLQITHKSIEDVTKPQDAKPFTYVFDVAATGNAVACVAYRGTYTDAFTMFRWMPNGDFYFNYDPAGTGSVLKKYGNLDRTASHTIAISLDPNGPRHSFYVDGVKIDNKGNYITAQEWTATSNQYNEWRFGMDTFTQKNTTGTVTFSNAEAYFGAYKDYNGRTVASNKNDVQFIKDGNNIIATASKNSDVASDIRYTIYIASYKDGVLEGINLKEVGLAELAMIDIPYNASHTTKAFFWTTDGLAPISMAEYKPEA